MFNTTSKRFAALVATVALVASVAAPAAASAGTVKVDGSTSLQPLAQQWANAFHSSNPSINVVVAGGGSGVGEADAGAGKVDIGMSSKYPADINQTKVTPVPVARDAVAIIVNPKNNVKVLTFAQIQGTFLGKYKNWRAIGGKTHKGFNANHGIDLVGRTGASGTYDFFKVAFLGGKPQSKKTRAYATSGMVRAAVARDPYAIGYVSMAYLNRTIRGIGVAGAKGQKAYGPSKANINNGKYKYWRYLYFLRQAGTSWSAEAQAFYNYCVSAAGQKIANVDYLSLN